MPLQKKKKDTENSGSVKSTTVNNIENGKSFRLENSVGSVSRSTGSKISVPTTLNVTSKQTASKPVSSQNKEIPNINASRQIRINQTNSDGSSRTFEQKQGEFVAQLSKKSKKALEDYYTAKSKGVEATDAYKRAEKNVKWYDNSAVGAKATQKMVQNYENAARQALKLQGIDDFDSAYEYYSMFRDQERSKAKQNNTANDYEKSSTLGKIAKNVGTAMNSPANGLQAIPELVKGLTGGYANEDAPLNVYSNGFEGINKTDTIRGKTREDIKESAGKTAATAYDIGMGIGDSAASMVLGGLGKGTVLATQAANAAAQSAKEATERGVNAKKAATTGVASGAIEAATEFLPLDNLFKTAKTAGKTGVKNAIKSILKQSAIEASEESISELANTIADGAINGADSKYELARQSAFANGATWDEATKQANKYLLGNIWQSALGGAVSGGVMGAGATLLNRAMIPRLEKNNASTDTVNTVENQQNKTPMQEHYDTLNQMRNANETTVKQNGKKYVDQVELALSDKNISKTHTPEQIAMMQEYVNSTDQNLVEYVRKARESKGKIGDFELSVSDRAKDDISRITGIDSSDNRLVVNKSTVAHVDRRHGINGKANKSMADDNTFGRIQYVLDNYDIAVKGNRSREYRMANGDFAPTVLFEKKVDGTYYVVEAVTDSAAKRNVVVSAYMDKKGIESVFDNKKGSTSGAMSEDLGRYVRNDSDSTSSTNTISTLQKNVNESDIGELPWYNGDNGSATDRVMKTSQTATNTFRKSDLYEDARFKDMVESDIANGRYDFESVSHEKAYAKAGEDVAKNYTGETQRLLSGDWTDGSTDVAKAHIIKQQALADGDMETVSNMAWKTAEQAHKAGQALEALKTYQRTPDGVIQHAYNYAYSKMQKWEKKNVAAVSDFKNASDTLSQAFDKADAYNNILAGVKQELNAHKYTKKVSEDAAGHIADMITNGAKSDDIYQFLARYESVGIDILDADTVETVMQKVSMAEEMGDSKESAKIMNDVYATIADKIAASSGMEKVNAWRYMCLLSSPTTHSANISSTSCNYLLHKISRNIQAVMEKALNVSERTSSILNVASKKDRDLLKQSRDYITNKAYSIYKGENRINVERGIESNKKVFKNRFLEAARNAESGWLDKEDWIFIKLNGSEYLASYLKANGADSSIFTATDEQSVMLLNKAVEYSAQKAKEATYHEASKLAEFMGNWKKSAENGGAVAKTLYTAANAEIPFASITENFPKEALRYSPLQLGKAIGEVAVPKIRKGMSTADLLEDFAQGLTGTAAFGLGVALMANGIINDSGSDDEEQREFDELQGLQPYSLNFSFGGKDYTYTIDGILGSGGMSLLAGANLYRSMKNNGLTLNDVATVLSQLSDPLIDQSFVKGFNELLQTVKYAESGHELSELAASVASNYATQFFPTLGKRVANAVNGEAKTTYTGKTGIANTLAKTGYKVINSIPRLGNMANEAGNYFSQSEIDALRKLGDYLSNANQPYLNQWGEHQENVGNNFGEKLAYQLGSKGFLQEYNTSEIESALQSINDNAKEDVSVFPESPRPSVTIDKKDIRLNPKQYTEYQESVGKYRKEILDTFIKSDLYKTASADESAEIVNNVYNWSMRKSESELFGKELSSTDKKLDSLYNKYGSNGIIFYYGADYISRSDENNRKKNGDERSLGESPVTNQYRYLMQAGMNSSQAADFLYESAASDKECALYESYGSEALGDYYSFKSEICSASDEGKYDSELALLTLTHVDIPDDLKGAYLLTAGSIELEKKDGSNTKVGKIRKDLGDGGVYRYYLYKDEADYSGNNSLSKDEITYYLNQQNMTNAERNYWFDILSGGNTKNPY